jgi:MscS family membrane protein
MKASIPTAIVYNEQGDGINNTLRQEMSNPWLPGWKTCVYTHLERQFYSTSFDWNQQRRISLLLQYIASSSWGCSFGVDHCSEDKRQSGFTTKNVVSLFFVIQVQGGIKMNIYELTSDQWLDIGISAAIISIAILVGRWIIKLVIGRGIRAIVGKTETELDDAILRAAIGPLHWLIIALAVDYGLRRLAFLPSTWEGNLSTFLYIVYFLIGTIFALRLIAGVMDWYGKTIDKQEDMSLASQMLPFIRRVAMIVIGVIALVTILNRFTDVSALLATLGVGSLAIALAAQSSLQDLFSGFLIMFDRPYLIGDRIEVQELDTWGDVVDIGLRSTRIRTRDNRFVIVPNSIMGKNMVVNYSRPDTQYRNQIEIEVAYGSDVELVRKTIIEAVKQVEGVLQDRKIEALFLNFSTSGMVFRVRWWLDSYYDTRRMFDRVNTAIYCAFDEAGIEIGNLQIDAHHFISENEIEKVSTILEASG